MHQLVALLSASATETFDQPRRTYDEPSSDDSALIQDCHSDSVTSASPSASPPSSHHHNITTTSTANSSFSIEHILSSPQRRNHSNDQQHQQLDKYLHHQTTDESRCRVDHGDRSRAIQVLPALPLSRPFYGQYGHNFRSTLLVRHDIISQ